MFTHFLNRYIASNSACAKRISHIMCIIEDTLLCNQGHGISLFIFVLKKQAGKQVNLNILLCK